MEEDKITKQIVPLDVGYSSKKKRNLMRFYWSSVRGRMEWDALPVEVWHQKRQEEIKPIMDEFFDLCREHSVLPDRKLGKAIGL